MKFTYSFLATLFAITASVTTMSAQTPVGEEGAKKFDFIDLVPDGKSYDGYIYVVDEKHYVVESTDAFFAALKIDPKKDVKATTMIITSNPHSKDKVEAMQRLVPEKYRGFKGIGIFQLHKQ